MRLELSKNKKFWRKNRVQISMDSGALLIQSCLYWTYTHSLNQYKDNPQTWEKMDIPERFIHCIFRYPGPIQHFHTLLIYLQFMLYSSLISFPCTTHYLSLTYTVAINTLHLPISWTNWTYPYTTSNWVSNLHQFNVDTISWRLTQLGFLACIKSMSNRWLFDIGLDVVRSLILHRRNIYPVPDLL